MNAVGRERRDEGKCDQTVKEQKRRKDLGGVPMQELYMGEWKGRGGCYGRDEPWICIKYSAAEG